MVWTTTWVLEGRLTHWQSFAKSANVQTCDIICDFDRCQRRSWRNVKLAAMQKAQMIVSSLL